jgi:hypothetical protein
MVFAVPGSHPDQIGFCAIKKERPLHWGEAVFHETSSAGQQGTELLLAAESIMIAVPIPIPIPVMITVMTEIVAVIAPVAINKAVTIPIAPTIVIVTIEAARVGPAARSPVAAVVVAVHPYISGAWVRCGVS